MYSHYRFRDATAEDAPKLVRLIEKVFSEYDMVFDADFEVPDLLHFDRYYGKNSGLPVLKVATTLEDKPVACAALKPDNRGAYFSRVYVSKTHRRNGLAKELIMQLLEVAMLNDIHYVHLWTDTQFKDAHRFYERLDFTYTGHVRPLNDPNNCYEYHYERLI